MVVRTNNGKNENGGKRDKKKKNKERKKKRKEKRKLFLPTNFMLNFFFSPNERALTSSAIYRTL